MDGYKEQYYALCEKRKKDREDYLKLVDRWHKTEEENKELKREIVRVREVAAEVLEENGRLRAERYVRT